MTMVQWKSGCDYYFLSYEHYYLPILPSKRGLKRCFLLLHLERRGGPTATVTSLKVSWNEDPNQALQGKLLSSRIMLHTQRSRPFPKPKESLIFGFLAKGGPHETFLESFNFTNG